MNRNRARNLPIIVFNEKGVYLLDFIKKLLYFIKNRDISYSYSEDYDKDKEIYYYYYYIMKI